MGGTRVPKVVPDPVTGSPPHDAPRWARPFVAVFLALFVVTGLLGIEAWPLTGWRLFAAERTARQVGYRATVVRDDGAEAPLSFGRLGPAFRGSTLALARFPEMPAAEREAVCSAWAGALRARGRSVREIRVYRESWDVTIRDGPRAAPPATTDLVAVCARGGGP
ncbi:MAG: hypothetical protein HY658_12750 [Actinobacteria bacterium]|nr:hypothetical protein [Actinomycetota bacterium]